MTTPVPPYGLASVVPEDAVAAWGARAIVTQYGHVDFVSDRAGADGPEESKRELFIKLDERLPMQELRAAIGELLEDGLMNTREREDFILYMDDELIVHANTQASAGYCYVTAWLSPAAS